MPEFSGKTLKRNLVKQNKNYLIGILHGYFSSHTYTKTD